jgi:hypothetical protein
MSHHVTHYVTHLPHDPPRPRGRTAPPAGAMAGALLALALGATALPAQTDYYNTDAGRPIQVEDAYAVERRAVELQVAPLRLERSHGGVYAWGVEPEVAVGLLPRTQVELGFPLAYVDLGSAGRRAGLAGIDLSVLHNLNTETRIPALAVAADVVVPVGSLAADRAYASVKGIATRTFPWARFHANGQYTFGDEPSDGDGALGGGVAELSRWMAGLAVDRTLPLRSLLMTGEVTLRQPLADEADAEWSGGAGARYQLSPRVAGDAGGGYRFTGDDRGWFVTFGAAVALGLPWGGR